MKCYTKFNRFFDRYQDLGLLLLRLGLGGTFVWAHGFPKLMGGVERWEGLGQSAMGLLGISFFPVFWGFLAMFAEFFGSILVALGLFFRPAVLLLLITMIMATLVHISAGDPAGTIAHPMKMAAVFLGLFFVGAGRYAFDRKLVREKSE